MTSLFIQLRLLDVLDILLVSFLMYQLYILIRGTVALNIFVVILVFYVGWLTVRALNMVLLGTILDKVINVGLIAMIILFQQEIRRFMVFVGTKYFSHTLSFDNMLSVNPQEQINIKTEPILTAIQNMAESKTGALVVITRKSNLDLFAQSGLVLNADCSSRMIESIFFKNSPLHDGAVLIKSDKIAAAKCVLPLSDSTHLPSEYGLRHRAALGITEHTDAFAIIVSEETGEIATADKAVLSSNVSIDELKLALEREFAV